MYDGQLEGPLVEESHALQYEEERLLIPYYQKTEGKLKMRNSNPFLTLLGLKI
jgi:hypothetical protein